MTFHSAQLLSTNQPIHAPRWAGCQSTGRISSKVAPLSVISSGVKSSRRKSEMVVPLTYSSSATAAAQSSGSKSAGARRDRLQTSGSSTTETLIL